MGNLGLLKKTKSKWFPQLAKRFCVRGRNYPRTYPYMMHVGISYIQADDKRILSPKIF